VPSQYVLSLFSLLPPKTSFVQLQVCNLTDHGQVVTVLLYAASCVSTSQGLCCPTGLHFSILCHHVTIVVFSLHIQ